MHRRQFLKSFAALAVAPVALVEHFRQLYEERQLKRSIQAAWREGEVPGAIWGGESVISGFAPGHVPKGELVRSIDVYVSDFGVGPAARLDVLAAQRAKTQLTEEYVRWATRAG